MKLHCSNPFKTKKKSSGYFTLSLKPKCIFTGSPTNTSFCRSAKKLSSHFLPATMFAREESVPLYQPGPQGSFNFIKHTLIIFPADAFFLHCLNGKMKLMGTTASHFSSIYLKCTVVLRWCSLLKWKLFIFILLLLLLNLKQVESVSTSIQVCNKVKKKCWFIYLASISI